ncbi:MAG: hypothetical protein MJ232_00290 [archaeon]|nr:hypothetical protein [Bacilli bacterium]MCQ2976441.1 hypothetical protein [archaeon]
MYFTIFENDHIFDHNRTINFFGNLVSGQNVSFTYDNKHFSGVIEKCSEHLDDLVTNRMFVVCNKQSYSIYQGHAFIDKKTYILKISNQNSIVPDNIDNLVSPEIYLIEFPDGQLYCKKIF